MSTSRGNEWLAPGALLTLGLVPIAVGAVRLAHLATGLAQSSDDIRFLATPLPVALHLVGAIVFSVLGALQFAPGLRRRHARVHRAAGRLLVPLGLVVALSGLWMNQFHLQATTPPASFDGAGLYVVRLLAGSAMAVFLCLGLAAVLQRDMPAHQGWMMRAYALGLGAGTQVFTHLPWFLFPGIQGELARTLSMAAGWLINLAVAECLIARARQRAIRAAGGRTP